MKMIRDKKGFNLNNKKGMAMLQFMIVVFVCFVILAVFLEIGYVLRSEAALAIVVKDTVRECALKGRFDNSIRDDMVTRLNASNLEVTYVGFRIDTNPGVEKPLTGAFNTPLNFREDFGLLVKANHDLRAINFENIGTIKIPLVYSVTGRSEYFNKSDGNSYK